MTREESPPESWLARVFPTIVRYSGLAVSLWLIVTARVDPSVGLGFAGTMISGSLAAEAWLKNRGDK